VIGHTIVGVYGNIVPSYKVFMRWLSHYVPHTAPLMPQTHIHMKEILRHTQTQQRKTEQDVSAELLNSTRCAISSKAFAAITLCGTTYHLLLTIERL